MPLVGRASAAHTPPMRTANRLLSQVRRPVAQSGHRDRSAALGAIFALLGSGCSAPSGASLDAGRDDTRHVEDAGGDPSLRLDVATCPGLALANASVMGCDTAGATAPFCDRVLDVPSFTTTADSALCDDASAAVDGVATMRFDVALEVSDVSCAGMTIGASGATARVVFGDLLQAADLAANAPIRAFVLTARVEGGECTRTLVLENPGAVPGIELHDVPATGGTVTSQWLDGMHVAPVTAPLASCPDLGRVCVSQAAAVSFALDPCGGAGLPIGGCGDPVGAGFAGASSCGGRIHFAIFPTYYVRVCH